ncbi:MAG: DotU family type IV/VI secretion system protein [Planctomycetaceae bacterium]|nr:DotU family type IV/VI secretion system protein [Planctomycetaceae bacterium]
MTPRFASAVDPVFRQGLVLLDRIQRGDRLDPEQEQLRLLAHLEQGDVIAGSSQEWRLAQYALVSWLDEMLVDTPWNGQDWWSNNVLEMALYQTRDCHERFYVLAAEAAEASRRDALHVFHDCVVLGFRGLYRDSSLVPDLTRRHGLPPDVLEWLRRTQLSIRVGDDRRPLAGAVRRVKGARPLASTVRTVWAWMAAAILLALNIAFYRMLLA